MGVIANVSICVHFCAEIYFAFSSVCLCARVCVVTPKFGSQIPVNVCVFACFACVHLFSSFAQWLLSPDVSAWEQRRTMVTKSQRAIAWGGATPDCRLTGFTNAFIPSAYLWANGCCVHFGCVLSPRDAGVAFLEICTGEVVQPGSEN